MERELADKQKEIDEQAHPLTSEEKKKLEEVSKLECDIVESERVLGNYDYKLEAIQNSLESFKYGLPSI